MRSVRWSDWAYLAVSILAYYMMTTDHDRNEEWAVKILWHTVKTIRWTRRQLLGWETALLDHIDAILEEGRTF